MRLGVVVRDLGGMICGFHVPASNLGSGIYCIAVWLVFCLDGLFKLRQAAMAD
jgi:hypothetical protein